MTEKIKAILRYLAFLLTLTVLMFSLFLNVVKAADRNQTADGSQTTDSGREKSGRTICSGASIPRTGLSDLYMQMNLQRKTAF